MKFSVIIPTRERATYLHACLRSALVAADNAGCEVEIVVSDNASEDDTAEVVTSLADPRIRYQRAPRRLSMRRNFEFALGMATGSHVIFIGDDDAVLPHGLGLLRRLVEDTGADLYKWRVINYRWPDPETGVPGYLKVRPQAFSGRRSEIAPRALLARLMRARYRSHRDGAMIYHGCISRRVIERARERNGGTYFWCSSPDLYSSIQNLMASDRPLIRIEAPVTLGGISPRSNGASGQKLAHQADAVEGSEFARFIAESEGDPFQGALPASCPSIALVMLDCLLTAARNQSSDLRPDPAVWAARIAADIRGMRPEVQAECAAHARALLGAGVELPLGARAGALPDEATGARAPRSVRPGLRRRLHRIDIAGAGMEDVAAAAATLDRLVGLRAAPVRDGGLLAGVLAILALHRRAAALAATTAASPAADRPKAL